MAADMKVSTHPISATAIDTQEAENLFDGISYGKGASFLKVLFKYVGEENFREGVRMYFAKYAGGNTNCDDFVLCQDISSNANGELAKWADTWLKTKGV